MFLFESDNRRTKGKNREPRSRENSVRNFTCDRKLFPKDAATNPALIIILIN
jgi:ribosomal protein S26